MQKVHIEVSHIKKKYIKLYNDVLNSTSYSEFLDKLEDNQIYNNKTTSFKKLFKLIRNFKS